MDDEAPKDFLGRLVGWLDESTWLPQEYKIAGGLMILSASSRGKIVIVRSIERVKPNLYTLFVGESDTGKTLVMRRVVERMLKDLGLPVLPTKDATPEGLISELAPHNPCNTYIYSDEMGTMIKRAEYQSGMVELLNQLYDSPDTYRRGLSKSKNTVKKPFIVLGLGVQPKRFVHFSESGVISTGLMSRFLVVPGKYQEEWDAPAREDLYVLALESGMIVKEVIDACQANTEVVLTQNASRMLSEYVRKLKSEESGADWWSKISGIMIRLSFLFMLNRHCSTSDEDEKQSMFYYQRLTRMLTQSVSPDKGDKREKRDSEVNRVKIVNCVNTVKGVMGKALWGVSGGGGVTHQQTQHSPDFTSMEAALTDSLTLQENLNGEEETRAARITMSDMASAITLIEWMRPEINKALESMAVEKNVRERRRVIETIHHLAKTNRCVIDDEKHKWIRNRDILIYTQIRERDLREHIEFAVESGIIAQLKREGRMKLYHYLGDGEHDT
jgi:hypothetical protein